MGGGGAAVEARFPFATGCPIPVDPLLNRQSNSSWPKNVPLCCRVYRDALLLPARVRSLRWAAVAATCLAVAPSLAPGCRLPTAPHDYLAKAPTLARKNGMKKSSGAALRGRECVCVRA
jgi:hypothetical protein